MTSQYDVAIIGGGIVGLAHAWMAAKRGLSVLLLERSAAAEGASVRNFGMIWPVGQPAGELYEIALRSRDLWCELDAQGVVEAHACGSLHLAHQPDELAVLNEFCELKTHQVEMLGPGETCKRTAIANPDGLLGGMYSSTELRVDPRTACHRILTWLTESHRVDCHLDTSVVRVEDNLVDSADGRRWKANRIIVCSGNDLKTLFRQTFDRSDLQLCKLQMLKTSPQSLPLDKLSPHIASGLTLRHYTSFRACPSHEKLKTRIQSETPELDRFGIHVMASIRPDGKVILGDSHEYGADISPFDNAEIDELILRELRKVIQLDHWTISQRWHGIYAKHPTRPVFEAELPHGVHIFAGTGGAGMTMSFGLADRFWSKWEGEP